MGGVRVVCLGLLACLCAASPARADVAGPWPWSRAPERPWGHGAPPPGWFEREQQMRELRQANDGNATPQPEGSGQGPDTTGQPRVHRGGAITTSIQEERNQRRTGPFRSCGSGMGVGLAGIGVAWGLMWVGTRYAGRIAKSQRPEGRDGGNA
jgi:hypothetical protein